MKTILILVEVLVILTFVTISSQNQVASHLLKKYFSSHDEVKEICQVTIHPDVKLESVFEETGNISEDENFKCFVKCILLKSGAMNEAGDLQPENIKRNIGVSDSLMNEIMELCGSYDRTDLCKAAKEVTDCGFKYLQSKNFVA